MDGVSVVVFQQNYLKPVICLIWHGSCDGLAVRHNPPFAGETISKEPTMTLLRTASLTLAAALTAGFAVPAFAAPASADTEETAPTALVHYGDLDLASEQGRATLRKRVQMAVNSVCAATADQFDPLKASIAYARCREEVGDVTASRMAAVLGQARFARR